MKTEKPIAASRVFDTESALDISLVDWLCSLVHPEDGAFKDMVWQLIEACNGGSLCVPSSFQNVPEIYLAVMGLAHESKPLILHRQRLYFHRTFRAEQALAQGLIRLSQKAPRSIAPLIPWLQTHGVALNGISLAANQKWALVAALQEKVFVLSGGPGTGKTAWTTAFLRAYSRLPETKVNRIKLCAPTGRAAKRLEESLALALKNVNEPLDLALQTLHVETVHHLLAYHPPTGRFARHAEDTLEADLVLLDEASMADIWTLAALVAALPESASLILVGDASQLPAVEAGSVLGELLQEPISGLHAHTWQAIAACFPESVPASVAQNSVTTIPAVILDQSHRSNATILKMASEIKAGNVESAIAAIGNSLETESFKSLEQDTEDLFCNRRIEGRTYLEWLEVGQDLFSEETVLQHLWEFLNQTRILTFARHGPFGCERINVRLQQALVSRFDSAASPKSAMFHGAPLLIQRNDATTGLSNGEMGIWFRGTMGLQACFPRPEKTLRLSPAFLPAWESAFAVTVHKSQGSECDEALIVLPEADHKLLSREILYTAITRARHRVRLLGSELALRQAIENRLIRVSGLREYFAPKPLS